MGKGWCGEEVCFTLCEENKGVKEERGRGGGQDWARTELELIKEVTVDLLAAVAFTHW